MGQILGLDNIPAITVASTTSLTLATTNGGQPTRITVMGQQYVPSATMTINTGTVGINGIDTGSLAANTLYYVYAVVSSNVLGWVISTNSSAPTGFTQYANIGRVKTFLGSAGLATSARWLNGRLTETVGVTNQSYTPSFSVSFGTVTAITGFFSTHLNKMSGLIRFKAGTVTAATAAVTLPNGWSIDTTQQAGDLNNLMGYAHSSSGGGAIVWGSTSFDITANTANLSNFFFAQVNAIDASNNVSGALALGSGMLNNNGLMVMKFLDVPIAELTGLYV